MYLSKKAAVLNNEVRIEQATNAKTFDGQTANLRVVLHNSVRHLVKSKHINPCKLAPN